MTKKTKATTKKLNASLTADLAPVRSDRRDVSIRKINNGYVLTESGTRAGKYFQRETYTPKQPKIVVGGITKD